MPEESYIYTSPLGHLLLNTDTICLNVVKFINEETTAAINDKSTLSPLLLKTVDSFNKYFSGEELCLDLPVKQKGTAFQQSVWNALLNIKPGITESYLGLSKNLGNVKAIRAVGAANGKNNIALVVPCHRVIGSNGQLVGYAAGIWRKNWLLQHEAKYCGTQLSLF